ncbi:MAG: tetratricopeptide repeat protein [Bacteroidales bacterium]
MNKKHFYIILFLLIIAKSSFAYFDFTVNCRKIHQQIMNLQLAEAQQLIETEKKANPSNIIPYYLENYKDFISIIISQDKNLFDQLLDKRSNLIDKIEKEDAASPYYNYCLADVYFQWAAARLIFMKDFSNVFEGLKAGIEIKKSYDLLESNQNKYPNFTPNLKLLGLMHAMIDAVPDSYKSMVKKLAFDGSFEQGASELILLTEKTLTDKNYDYLKSEALFILTFIEINLQGDKQKAIFLKKYFTHPEFIQTFKSSAVLLYSKARYEMFFGKNDDAILTLENFPRGKEYAYFGFIDYLTGKVKLNRLDKDAIIYFLNYTINYKGSLYIKSSYQHIAWYYLLNNDEKKYADYMQKTKQFGSTLSETDKQADYEAEKRDPPNIQLLKASVLCDGGYYQQALKILDGSNQLLQLRTTKDSLGFLYRMGRIYQEWEKTDAALPYYESVIRNGDDKPWYFACNAALQLGLIYESHKEITKARLYYKRCIGMSPKEYKNSLHAKAKAGLRRIGG